MSGTERFLAPKVDAPPAPLEPWRDILLKAAEIIERLGWCQGDYENERGEVCMVGAIGVACGFTPRPSDNDASADIEGTEPVLRLRGACGTMFAHNWNDAPGRTKEEVLPKLREVARA